MADGYNTLNYEKQGGDEWVVGGKLTVTDTGSITVGGVAITSSTLAVNGLTATAAELNNKLLFLDVADASADATYYLYAPFGGVISKIAVIVDGAVGTADLTVTASINGGAVTNGVVTVASSGSGAGSKAVATPSAANTVVAGDAISLAFAGAGSGGSPRAHVIVFITCQ